MDHGVMMMMMGVVMVVMVIVVSPMMALQPTYLPRGFRIIFLYFHSDFI